MTAPIQLDPQDCEILVAALRKIRGDKTLRADSLRSEVLSICAEIVDLDLRINRYLAAPKELGPVPTEPVAEANDLFNTPSGRAKRGETEKIIASKLSELNGSGSTITDLAIATGAKYSTVRRILIEMAAQKKAFKSSDTWHSYDPTWNEERPSDLSVNENGQTAEEGQRT